MATSLELCQKRKELVDACIKTHGVEYKEALQIVSQEIGIKATTIRDDITRLTKVSKEEDIETDEELEEYCVKLAKQKQKLQDTNRIERKAFRESARIENAIESLNEELIKILKKNSFHTWAGESQTNPSHNGYGVIQFSDTHLNELVDLPTNKYDIEIANKRIRKHVTESIEYFQNNDIGTVLVAFTGDLINSDRRLDEKLNMSTNRMRAMFLAIDIFKQAIEELSCYFNIHVASVTGNESRVNEEYGWSDAILSDNYDYAIHNILKKLFEGRDRVSFIGDCEAEKVVNVDGVNLLMVHGNQIPKNITQGLGKMKARYMASEIDIDYMIHGHLHECLIADTYARSASTVGANAYSENGLQLVSRASQNCYRIKDGSMEGHRIDLQNVDNYDGYDITESIMAYNPKSSTKLKSQSTIFSVVI